MENTSVANTPVTKSKDEPSSLTKFVNESIAKREKAVAELVKKGASSTEAKYAIAEKFKAEANAAVKTSMTGSIQDALKTTSVTQNGNRVQGKMGLFDALLKGNIISKSDSDVNLGSVSSSAGSSATSKGLVQTLKSRIVDLDI